MFLLPDTLLSLSRWKKYFTATTEFPVVFLQSLMSFAGILTPPLPHSFYKCFKFSKSCTTEFPFSRKRVDSIVRSILQSLLESLVVSFKMVEVFQCKNRIHFSVFTVSDELCRNVGTPLPPSFFYKCLSFQNLVLQNFHSQEKDKIPSCVQFLQSFLESFLIFDSKSCTTEFSSSKTDQVPSCVQFYVLFYKSLVIQHPHPPILDFAVLLFPDTLSSLSRQVKCLGTPSSSNSYLFLQNFLICNCLPLPLFSIF